MVVRARLGELAGGWRHAYVRAACLTLGKARAAPSATRRCIAVDELRGQRCKTLGSVVTLIVAW